MVGDGELCVAVSGLTDTQQLSADSLDSVTPPLVRSIQRLLVTLIKT